MGGPFSGLGFGVETKIGRSLIGRFKEGKDLLQSIIEFCQRNSITQGTFILMGATMSQNISYYSQTEKKFMPCNLLNSLGRLEIASCIGNISLRDGQLAVHAHITLADEEGRAYGGHVNAGTILFAGEIFVTELLGEQLHRGEDVERTGLPLWVK